MAKNNNRPKGSNNQGQNPNAAKPQANNAQVAKPDAPKGPAADKRRRTGMLVAIAVFIIILLVLLALLLAGLLNRSNDQANSNNSSETSSQASTDSAGSSQAVSSLDAAATANTSTQANTSTATTSSATSSASSSAGSNSGEVDSAQTSKPSSYSFTAGAGDSVSWLVRRAMYAYMGDNGLGLSRGQKLFFEVTLANSTTPATLNIGETRTFSVATLKSVFDLASTLSADQLALWNNAAVTAGYI